MDFITLAKDTVKIKTKKATFTVSSTLPKGKLEHDALLLIKVIPTVDLTKSLILSGPGEYEIAGAKISVVRQKENLLYVIKTDNMSFCIGEAAALNAMKEKLDECSLVLIFAETLIEESAITNLQPKVVLCVGEKAQETATLLLKDAAEAGSSSSKPVEKFSITADKLPSEVQIVLLG